MRKALIILAVQISTIGSLIACGCNGPMNDLKTDIDSSYAIFIGVITEINKSHVFHLNDGIGTGLAFINFAVLKSYKGLNPAQLKITLFDSGSNSSCEGIAYGKNIGDTVLVFAEEFLPQMLGSDLCGRHTAFRSLSPEEADFVDTVKWVDPKTKHIHWEEFLKRKFPKPNESRTKETKNSDQDFLILILCLSAGINLIFGFLLLRKKVNAG